MTGLARDTTAQQKASWKKRMGCLDFKMSRNLDEPRNTFSKTELQVDDDGISRSAVPACGKMRRNYCGKFLFNLFRA
jgi:hypothetical protein